MQTVKISQNRTVVPNKIVVGNKYENEVEKIKFQSPDYDGNRYLIINKYTESYAASNAMTSATETAQANISSIQQASATAQSNIAEAKDSAIEAVQSEQVTAEQAIVAKQSQSLEAIETAKDEAIEEIENTGVPLEDIEKLAIKETTTGNPTIISDSADWRLQKLNVYGQSEQASTTGINILDYSKKKALDSEYYDVDENGYVIQLQKDNRVNNTLPEIIKLPIPEEIQAQYKALKSYYPNTAVQTGAFNEVEYVADTKMYIDNKLAGVTELALGGK